MCGFAFTAESVQTPEFRTMMEPEIARLGRYAWALTGDVSAATRLPKLALVTPASLA
jgi:hypothetical protein